MTSGEAYAYCSHVSDLAAVREKITEDKWILNYCILIRDDPKLAKKIKDPKYLNWYNIDKASRKKKDTKNDPTGMLTATIIDGDLIVYDYWAKHLELFDCVNEIENTYNEKGDIRSKVIIETKASGISINTELKRKFN